MGNCGGSLTDEQKEELRRNRELEQQIVADNEKQNQKVKLLLLGAGESGKSTLFKQMKILYGKNHGFTDTEVKNMIPVVYNNVIVNMKTLVAACAAHTPVADQGLAEQVLALNNTDVIDSKLGETLSNVWNDGGVQATWLQRGDIQVQDALEYYMRRISEIASDDYLPSKDDILRSRVRTSGIVEEEFSMGKTEMVMFDVGGQRNERKKWIHAFEDVHAVIFVAAISEYDQYLYEDNTVNRQVEAVELFEKTCNEQWFKNSGMILFLNKSDLFQEKLRRVPFVVSSGPEARNTDFSGKQFIPGQSDDEEFEEAYDDACEYLKQLYKNQNHYPSQKEVYAHITCATNTDQMEKIMTSCKDIFLKVNLKENGFM